MPNRRYAILEAPSALGLATDGVEGLPDRLLALGLAERILRAPRRAAEPCRRRIRCPTRDRDFERPGDRGVVAQARRRGGGGAGRGRVPGGAGRRLHDPAGLDARVLRRRGRYGLFFIDGNADFFQPEAEPNGEGASMDLAFATGHGPALLTDIEGRSPLVRAEDAVAFAFRDHEDQAEFGSQPLPPELRAYDLPAVRRSGGGECRPRGGRPPDAGGAGRLLHPSRRRLSRRCHHAGGRFPRAGRPVVGRARSRAPHRAWRAERRSASRSPSTIRASTRTAAPAAAWPMSWPQPSDRRRA